MIIGPFTRTQKTHSEAFKKGNIIIPFEKNSAAGYSLFADKQYRSVEKSTWETVFPPKFVIFDILERCVVYPAFHKIFPIAYEIRTKDGKFSTIKLGWNPETKRLGFVIIEAPFNEFEYQSWYSFASVYEHPEVDHILWEDVENDQGAIYET